MTHTSQTTIKAFRKCFPEMSDYSDVEVTAYCRNLKREKKSVDRSISKSVKSYSKRNNIKREKV